MKKTKNKYSNEESLEKTTSTKIKNKGINLFLDVLIREFWGLIKLNWIMLLFFLPIITIPGSISAGSRIIIYMIQEKNVNVWKDFIRIFKRDFKQSLLCGMIFGILIFVAFFLFYHLRTEENNSIILVIQTVILFFLITIAAYTFTSIPLLDIPFLSAIKNSFILTVIRLPLNAIATSILIAIVFLSVIFFPFSLLWIAIFALSFINLTLTFCTFTGIDKYILNKDKLFPPQINDEDEI